MATPVSERTMLWATATPVEAEEEDAKVIAVLAVVLAEAARAEVLSV